MASMTPTPPRNRTPLTAVASSRRLRLGITAFAALLVAGTAIRIAGDLQQAYERTLSEAAAHADTLLTSLDEHLTQTLRGADAVAELAQGEAEAAWREGGFDTPALFRAFQRLHRGAPFLSTVGLADAHGRGVVHSLSPAPPGTDVSQRGYFIFHSASESPETRVNTVVRSAITGRAIVPVTRRLNDSEGRFTGIVLASLDSAYFQKFYGRVHGPGETLGLIAADGTLLTRLPEESDAVRPLEAMPLLRRELRDRPAGWFPQPAREQGPRQHVYYRRASEADFVFVLARDDESLFAHWREEVRESAVKAAIALLTVLVFASLLIRASLRQERLTRELDDSQARFRDFAEASSDWMWESGPDHRFIRFTGEAGRLGEIQRAALGKSSLDLADPQRLPPDWRRHVEDLEARRPFRDFAYRIVLSEGDVRYVKTSGKPIYAADGEFLGYRGTGSDITDAVRAEEERRALEERLRHRQRLEAVGTLAGGMAHEINNKLVPIVAFSELMLADAPADSKDRAPLSKIRQAANRIRDLVSHVLAMSRSETPGRTIVELRTVAAGAVDLLRATLPPNVALILEAETAGRILGNAGQIEQALVNLCTNAAHAIGNRPGEIRIALDETAAADGGQVRLRVGDTGGGMPPEVLPRIFEPFFTTKGVGEGTGLGLAIVHGIVTGHGGRMDVDSQVGRGTVFTILLPRAPGQEEAGGTSPADASRAAADIPAARLHA
jgi:PAS domain S-box-containing protein